MEKFDHIGRQLVLWNIEYKIDAYTDQLGIKHAAYVVKEQVLVKIVKVKSIKGMWRQSDTYEGWKAVSDDGREFGCNWGGFFPDDSMTPTYYWSNLTDDIALEWVDAQQAYGLFGPYVTPEGGKVVPISPILVCEKHNKAYIPNDRLNDCLFCFAEKSKSA